MADEIDNALSTIWSGIKTIATMLFDILKIMISVCFTAIKQTLHLMLKGRG